MLNRRNSPRRFLQLTLLLSLFLVSCATLVHIPMEHRTPLLDGTDQKSTFISSPLKLTYSYQVNEGNLRITGQLTSTSSSDSADLRLVLLDESGSIIFRRLLYSSGYRSDDAREGTSTPIQVQLPLPVGASSFAFTCDFKQRSSRP